MPPPKMTKPQGDVIRFRFEGVEYVFDRADVTGELERTLWKQTGLSVGQVGQAAADGALFGVAALMWMARRQAGHNVPYVTVETEVYDAVRSGEVDLELIADDEQGGDDAGPPVEDANSET